MRHSVLSFIIILFVHMTSIAQSEPSTWLWQISGGELQGKSYIFGTMPIQDSLFYNFPNKVWKYVDRSDVVLAFANEGNTASSNLLPKNEFAHFKKDYSLLPAAYIQSYAKENLKPIIAINPDYHFSSLSNQSSKATQPTLSQSHQLTDAYLSAQLPELVDLRLQFDVPSTVYSDLEQRTNYLLLNQLVDYMKLQPVFLPIDAIYLSGKNGLIALLRARGYQVKPLESKFYARAAKEIATRNALREQWNNQNQPPTPPTAPSTSEQVIKVDSAPSTVHKLDLPMGIINLSEWSNYTLKDIYTYNAPIKLKETSNPEKYSASYDGLNYTIEFKPFSNKKDVVDYLMITNGGQLVAETKLSTENLKGEFIELMYTENQISKHLILNGPIEQIILSVKGDTPAIYSLLANTFLQTFHVKQKELTYTANTDSVTDIVEPEEVQWKIITENSLTISFPSSYEKVVKTTETHSEMINYISSQKFDRNTYLLSSSTKDAFDNFKLFNDAINEATQLIRGVIVERDVMPDGNDKLAEYLLKDAIDNYYRIMYLYDGQFFYQLIIKGDKQSVHNDYAEQIFQSIIFH